MGYIQPIYFLGMSKDGAWTLRMEMWFQECPTFGYFGWPMTDTNMLIQNFGYRCTKTIQNMCNYSPNHYKNRFMFVVRKTQTEKNMCDPTFETPAGSLFHCCITSSSLVATVYNTGCKGRVLLLRPTFRYGRMCFCWYVLYIFICFQPASHHETQKNGCGKWFVLD